MLHQRQKLSECSRRHIYSLIWTRQWPHRMRGVVTYVTPLLIAWDHFHSSWYYRQKIEFVPPGAGGTMPKDLHFININVVTSRDRRILGKVHIYIPEEKEVDQKSVLSHILIICCKRPHASGLMSYSLSFFDSFCDIDGILPKGPYPPCLRMADWALLAGYSRHMLLEVPVHVESFIR